MLQTLSLQNVPVRAELEVRIVLHVLLKCVKGQCTC